MIKNVSQLYILLEDEDLEDYTEPWITEEDIEKMLNESSEVDE